VTALLYVDLVIYSLVFAYNRLLGFILLSIMAGAMWFNLHGGFEYQTLILILASITLFFKGGDNYKALSGLFALRAYSFIVDGGLADSALNHVMVIAQILISIDSDSSGGTRSTWKNLYDKSQLFKQTHSFNSIMYRLHRTSSR